VPGLLELNLYAFDKVRNPVVKQSPDQAENLTKNPVEDGQEYHEPGPEQQPGKGIRGLGARHAHGRARQREKSEEDPKYQPTKA
jgi:hypothetical protein